MQALLLHNEGQRMILVQVRAGRALFLVQAELRKARHHGSVVIETEIGTTINGTGAQICPWTKRIGDEHSQYGQTGGDMRDNQSSSSSSSSHCSPSQKTKPACRRESLDNNVRVLVQEIKGRDEIMATARVDMTAEVVRDFKGGSLGIETKHVRAASIEIAPSGGHRKDAGLDSLQTDQTDRHQQSMALVVGTSRRLTLRGKHVHFSQTRILDHIMMCGILIGRPQWVVRSSRTDLGQMSWAAHS